MKGILFSGTVENIRTRKDHTVALTIGTQELTPEEGARLFALNNRLSMVYINAEINKQQIEQVDKHTPEMGGKSQSERIRNTLYLLFNQDKEGYLDFDNYYHAKTEKYITMLKSKIHEPV